MAEYPACAEGASEEIESYGLINYIRKERADVEEI